MSIPDRITVLRIILAPVFFGFFFMDRLFAGSEVVSIVGVCVTFLAIECSDLLDGILARKLGAESERGKLLDPFADSVSRLTYFICFAAEEIMPVWALLLVVYRDIGVGFIRQLLSKEGVALGAKASGKTKAIVYAIAGIVGIVMFSFQKLLIFQEHVRILGFLGCTIFGLCGAVALWSLIDYARSLQSGGGSVSSERPGRRK